MNNENNRDRKFAVEKYLEQVKILTALATALLISPNVFLLIRQVNSQTAQILENAVKFLLIANIAFIVSIILTYFIYSSVVGKVNAGIYDVDRPATRVFSLLQLAGIIVGCVSLLIFFFKII